MINLLISSKPLGIGERNEFHGKRLSDENAPRPNGLGEGIRKEDIQKRSFQKTISAIIIKDNEE